MHLISNPVDWYAARAAGITAYVLLSAVVILGVTMAGKAQIARWPRFAIEDVHRLAGILAGSFITLHVVTVALDAYLPFPIASVIVPGLSSYRPLWVAFGIVAAELLLAIAITNHFRDRGVRYAVWRRLHYLNFAVWLCATLHGLGTGTDRGSAWLLAIYTASAASVAAATAWRFLRLRPLAVGVGLATAGLVVAIALGPLHVSRRPWNSADANFTGPLKGSLHVREDLLYTAITVDGVGGGGQQVWLRADLLFEPRHHAMRASSFVMEYLPNGLRCRGSVSSVEHSGFGFRARCRTTDGRRRVVDVGWKPSTKPELKGGKITSRGEA
jgi:sulfoxide reductase heme-binding subunit YedZ